MNEKLSVSVVFRQLITLPEGKIFLATAFISIAMSGINYLDLLPTSLSSSMPGKWITTWALMPFLLFLILIRGQQILSGRSFWVVGFRCVLIVAPMAVLFFFNMKGHK